MPQDNTKALKVLELTQYIRGVKGKRKSICSAFTEEIKRATKELDDVLSGEPTTQEVVNSISEPHDLDFSE